MKKKTGKGAERVGNLGGIMAQKATARAGSSPDDLGEMMHQGTGGGKKAGPGADHNSPLKRIMAQ